jgi:hypothetical protein
MAHHSYPGLAHTLVKMLRILTKIKAHRPWTKPPIVYD